jgi:parallel beta-helix repeat protein
MHQVIKTILPMLAFAWAGTSQAATYYVRNGGNDSADGRTHATAWASINKVNGYAFAAGDSVLFQEGSRFVNQKLRVDWGGTATQRAIVGAYYLDGSTPRRGYRTARPTIDGEDRIPTSHYDGLVIVAGVDRVRIENLQVMNSEGRGIGISDSDESEVVGSSVRNTYSNGIHFLRSPRSLAENNFVTGQGVGNREDGAPWGSSIEFVASPDGVIRNNVVSEVFGEALNAHSGSDRTLIERNYVFGARAVGIYVDSSADVTVRRNIVVGTTNSTYWRSGSSVGAGIAVNNELYHYPEGGGSLSTSVQAKRAKIYGNLVAYTSTGLTLWGNLSSTSFDGTLIYNNTFVDNNIQVNMGVKPTPSSKFINNILLSLSSGTSDLGSTNLNGMVARNNYFSKGNPGGDYVHAGNRFTGLKLAKMSDWRAVTSRDQISWRDFVVSSDSPVIGAGDDEPRRSADNSNDYALDYNGVEHGAPMDMGALASADGAGPGAADAAEGAGLIGTTRPR